LRDQSANVNGDVERLGETAGSAALATPHQRVLMFVYHFPPLGGSMVQRNLKYVKYLRSEHFEPIVITGRTDWVRLRDRTLTRDVPSGVKVLRARTLPLQWAQWKVDGLLKRVGLPTRLVRQAMFPDTVVGWLPAAIWHAVTEIRESRPDVLYSSYLPATSHLAALIVHRLTGVPWVADFRDAWALSPGPAAHTDYSPPARAIAALERRVIAEASYTTVACDSIELLDLAPNDRRRVVIPNGVDEDDLPTDNGAWNAPRQDKFRLSYVGSLWGRHDAAPIFAAIRDLMNRGKLDPESFELRMVGNITLDRDELGSLPVTFTGYVDHQRAVAEMASASALLFTLPPGYPGSSSKIYEYLTAGRPILCVADPANLGFRLVRELGAGQCADGTDVAAVSRALERLLAEWRQGTLGLDHNVRQEALRRFSRRKLAGDLAAVLRSTINETRP
jgi:glycosyltransferase involved in cell wall biosynthesis